MRDACQRFALAPIAHSQFRWYHAENPLLDADLRRLQKVVIARRIQSDVPHPPRMHQHIVEVPQVDRRTSLARISCTPRTDEPEHSVGFAPRLFDQTVHPRIGIKSAVRSVGRKSRRTESLENVGILVPPIQRSEYTWNAPRVTSAKTWQTRTSVCRERFPPRGTAAAKPPPTAASILPSKSSS